MAKNTKWQKRKKKCKNVLKVLWNNNCENGWISKFQTSVNHYKIVEIVFDFVCTSVLLISTTCENFKSFGGLFDIASYSYLDHNF